MNYLKYGKTEDNSSYHIIDTNINDDNITHDIIDHLEMDCSANDQSVRYYFSDQNYIIIKITAYAANPSSTVETRGYIMADALVLNDSEVDTMMENPSHIFGSSLSFSDLPAPDLVNCFYKALFEKSRFLCHFSEKGDSFYSESATYISGLLLSLPKELRRYVSFNSNAVKACEASDYTLVFMKEDNYQVAKAGSLAGMKGLSNVEINPLDDLTSEAVDKELFFKEFSKRFTSPSEEPKKSFFKRLFGR